MEHVNGVVVVVGVVVGVSIAVAMAPTQGPSTIAATAAVLVSGAKQSPRGALSSCAKQPLVASAPPSNSRPRPASRSGSIRTGSGTVGLGPGRGWDIVAVIQLLLGHSSLATTATYVSHIAPAKAVAEATAKTQHLAVQP